MRKRGDRKISRGSRRLERASHKSSNSAERSTGRKKIFFLLALPSSSTFSLCAPKRVCGLFPPMLNAEELQASPLLVFPSTFMHLSSLITLGYEWAPAGSSAWAVGRQVRREVCQPSAPSFYWERRQKISSPCSPPSLSHRAPQSIHLGKNA